MTSGSGEELRNTGSKKPARHVTGVTPITLLRTLFVSTCSKVSKQIKKTYLCQNVPLRCAWVTVVYSVTDFVGLFTTTLVIAALDLRIMTVLSENCRHVVVPRAIPRRVTQRVEHLGARDATINIRNGVEYILQCCLAAP